MKTFIQYLDTQLTEEILDACQLDELIAATPKRVRAVAKRRAREAGRSRGWELEGDKEPAYSQYKDDSSFANRGWSRMVRKTRVPSEKNIPDASAQSNYKTERGYARAANDPKLSPKFKKKLNRMATKERTAIIRHRTQGGMGPIRDPNRDARDISLGTVPQQDPGGAYAEKDARTHKTPQKPLDKIPNVRIKPTKNNPIMPAKGKRRTVSQRVWTPYIARGRRKHIEGNPKEINKWHDAQPKKKSWTDQYKGKEAWKMALLGGGNIRRQHYPSIMRKGLAGKRTVVPGFENSKSNFLKYEPDYSPD